MNHHPLRLAFLTSLVFHGALLLFFLLYHFRAAVIAESEAVSIAFQSLPAMTAAPAPRHSGSVVQPSAAALRLPETTSGEAGLVLAAPQRQEALMGSEEPADSVAKPFFPVPIPWMAYTPSGTPQPTLPSLAPLRGNAGAFPDRGAAAMSPNAGTGPLFDVNSLLVQGLSKLAERIHAPEEAPVRLKTIPSVVAMAALCAIWEKGIPTESEIYSALPGEIPITAEGLHAVLAQMTAEGILVREIISPRFEFSFMTPIGAVPVEMSAKNRRNRVYRYASRIAAGEMMRFLQAASYQCLERAPEDTVSQKMINDHIQRLLQTSLP